jgi:glycosyltransferase involved in cell wall biosynthesis
MEMNTMIDISVVIPTYREDQKLFRQNIGYLKEQTAFKKKRMEIVIADFYEYDDISTADETVWPKQDEYFKIIHVDRRGIAYARHFGIMTSQGKAIVNFDADGFFVPNEAIDMLTAPILEGRAHLAVCDNVFDLRSLSPEEVESISFIRNMLDTFNNMQKSEFVGILEAGMTFSKEAYEFVGGFSDVKQYEGATLASKIIAAYTPFLKVYIPGVKAVLSPRRAVASVKYGLLNSYADYVSQNFR